MSELSAYCSKCDRDIKLKKTIGEPIITCRRCGNQVKTGMKQWRDFSPEEKTAYRVEWWSKSLLKIFFICLAYFLVINIFLVFILHYRNIVSIGDTLGFFLILIFLDSQKYKQSQKNTTTTY